MLFFQLFAVGLLFMILCFEIARTNQLFVNLCGLSLAFGLFSCS